ncbi:hypothetical protein ATO10_01975 [Actibacterium atlanticum]|uniref:Uncharacterized protein n=1 Tax=Actibacterium atlanticum TaxID=1461693 RepID=A0A058ZPG8_9RHOB|nr:glycosyltransferase family 92 protein [Actibacterium atlanticum]KCV83489.1 hypothetical protein ATO10_01975 [Actibacterium atlanticum]
MLRRMFPPKLLSKMRISPVAPQSGRAGVAAVLMVRNEALNIEEWARFHLAAGIDHVICYDDGSTDETVAILQDVLGDRLSLFPWQQRLYSGDTGQELHNQLLGYGHALANFGGRFRWMACIDADEFLVPKQADSLSEALAHLEHCGQISLPWHNFGRNGHEKRPKQGTVQSYTRRVADPMSGVRGVTNFKTIVDPCRVTALKVHSYEVDGKAITWNDRGEEFAIKDRTGRDFYATDHIQLNHYYSRSEEDVLAKIANGPIQTTAAERHTARIRRAVDRIEAEEVEDRCALDFLDRIKAG